MQLSSGKPTPPAVRAPKGAKTCNPKVPLAPLSMSRHTVLVMSQVTFLSGHSGERRLVECGILSADLGSLAGYVWTSVR